MNDPAYVTLAWMARRLRICHKRLGKYLASRNIRADIRVTRGNNRPAFHQYRTNGLYRLSKMVEYIPELAGRRRR